MRHLYAQATRVREFAARPVIDRLDDLALAQGRAWFATRALPVDAPLSAAEWKVFSQFGEDGILDFLLRHVRDVRDIPPTFIEFGVETYAESNTRFLCEAEHWDGLVLDGGRQHLAFARRRRLHHRGLTTCQAFLTQTNINETFSHAGFTGEVGVLSVDVDGVDYWLLKCLEVIDPVVVVVEHNSYFGAEAAVSVPYDPAFSRREKHPSGVYFGASIKAYDELLSPRGYRLIGSSSEGLNLFFVKATHCPTGWGLSPAEAYRPPRFSPTHLPDGRPVAVAGAAAGLALIRDLPLVDTRTGAIVPAGDLVIP